MSDIKQGDQHLEIHMKMLSQSENAKGIGDCTVIRLGHAVSIAEELINRQVITALEKVESKSTTFHTVGYPHASTVVELSGIQAIKKEYQNE